MWRALFFWWFAYGFVPSFCWWLNQDSSSQYLIFIQARGCSSGGSPKERRQKRRIIKNFRVHPHRDPELFPVQCFTTLRNHPHLQDRNRGPMLFVEATKFQQPVASHTTSSWLHRNFIPLSTSEPRVSIRSRTSSAALDKGVDLQDIVALGNWASSETFRAHHQRHHMATVNFASMVLDHADDEKDIFYDAEWRVDSRLANSNLPILFWLSQTILSRIFSN